MPSIVQFFHPGLEHGCDRQYTNNTYFKEWNKGDHKRKFIKNRGSYIENDIKLEGDILFWGEWEPTSIVETIDIPKNISPHEVYPKHLHYPFLPKEDKIKYYQNNGFQNTDPFVFGEKFRYSICLQDSFSVLNNLENGSIILFGSCVPPRDYSRFVIDTVFVVKDSMRYTSALDEKLNYLGLYTEIVIRMACKEDLLNNNICRTLYTGATYDDPINEMFSYVPAKKYEGEKIGFPRIVMPDDFYDQTNEKLNRYFSGWKPKNGVIYEGKNTGIKETYASVDEIKYFWDYLKEFISKNHVLGFNLEMPNEEMP